MPEFTVSARSAAPVEEVWKLLHDPTTYPRWWAGIGTVRSDRDHPDGTDFTMWPDGYPDFPMSQTVRSTPAGVTVSCLVSDLVFRWTLTDVGGTDPATTIRADVEIPEREAHRLDEQSRLLEASVIALADLAAGAEQP